MGLLDGKVAIVTGAGHGIGRGHALELAKEGAKVVVNDLGTSLKGEGTRARTPTSPSTSSRRRGGDASANYGNVTDSRRGALIDHAVDTFGRLDILVNNAGIARDAAIWNMTVDDWDAVIGVHLKGTFAPTHPAVGLAGAEQGGRGRLGRPGHQHHLGSRARRQLRPGQLHGRQGRHRRLHADRQPRGLQARRHRQLHRPGRRHPHGRIDPRRRHRGQGARRVRGVGPHGSVARSPLVAWLASDKAGTSRSGHPRGRRRDRAHEPWSNGHDPKPVQALGSGRATGLMNTDLFHAAGPGLRY